MTDTTDYAALTAALARPSNQKLAAYLKQELEAYSDDNRFRRFKDFKQYGLTFYAGLTGITDAALTYGEYDQLRQRLNDWFFAIAPDKPREKGKGADEADEADEAGQTENAENAGDAESGNPRPRYTLDGVDSLDPMIAGWRTRVTRNRRVEEALAGIDISEDATIDEREVTALAWNLLYMANATDYRANERELLKWILQSRGNIAGASTRHHPLLYVSRDRSDGSSAGGNGKSFVGEALRNVFDRKGITSTKAIFPSASSPFVFTSFADNILVQLDELPAPAKLNTEAVKQITENRAYVAHEKNKAPVEVPSRAMIVGSTNSQGWLSTTDEALKRRLYAINVNADLNLDQEHPLNVYDAVNEKHPLPTEDEIADAFLRLLRTPEKTLKKMIRDRFFAATDAVTDRARYDLGKAVNTLTHHDDPDAFVKYQNENRPRSDLDAPGTRIWIRPCHLCEELEGKGADGKLKCTYRVNRELANEILCQHFNKAKGFNFFRGGAWGRPIDVTDLWRAYACPDGVDLGNTFDPVAAYCKVWDMAHAEPVPDPDTPTPEPEPAEQTVELDDAAWDTVPDEAPAAPAPTQDETTPPTERFTPYTPAPEPEPEPEPATRRRTAKRKTPLQSSSPAPDPNGPPRSDATVIVSELGVTPDRAFWEAFDAGTLPSTLAGKDTNPYASPAPAKRWTPSPVEPVTY